MSALIQDLVASDAVGLPALGFSRRARGVMEREVTTDVRWRVATIVDRQDPPGVAAIWVGAFVPALEPLLKYRLPVSERPGVFQANLLVLAGRARLMDDDPNYDLSRFQRRSLFSGRRSREEVEALAIADLAGLVCDYAMPWFMEASSLRGVAAAYQRQVDAQEHTTYDMAQLWAVWTLAGDRDRAAAAQDRCQGSAEIRSYVKYLEKALAGEG